MVVIAPQRDIALGAAGHDLPGAAFGGDGDEEGVGAVGEEDHAVVLDGAVEGEGGAGFALAPAAVAAVDDEGWRGEAVADEVAGAATGEGEGMWGWGGHGRGYDEE